MANRLIDFLFRTRYLVLALYAAIALLALMQLPNLGFNFSFRQFFPPSDKEVQYYNTFTQTYAPDDVHVLIAITDDDLFAPELLTRLNDFTNALRAIDGIVDVVSITSIERPAWVNDTLYFNPLFANYPPDAAAIASARNYLTTNDRMRGNLISLDESTTTVIVELNSALNSGDNARRPVLEKMWAQIELLRPHVDRVLDGGIPISRSSYARLLANNTHTLIPLTMFVIVLVLAFSLRYWLGVVLSVAVIALALLFTLAIMVLNGSSITVMTTIMPVVILIIGVADAVHFHSRYYEELRNGRPKLEAIRVALKHMAVACLLTSVTTAVGFMVLMLTTIDILREYGLFVAIGVMFAYVISITFLPAALAVFPTPPPKVSQRYFSGKAGASLNWLSNQVSTNQRPWILISVSVVILAAIGSTQVHKNMRLLEDLSPDHPIITTQTFFEEKLGGVMPLEIILETDKKDGIKSPEAIRFLDDTKRYMKETIPEIGTVVTTADFIREMNRIMNDDQPAFETVPADQRIIAQYFMLYDMDRKSPVKQFTTSQKTAGRVSARVTDVYSPRADEITASLRSWLDKHVPDGMRYHITGTWPVAHIVNRYLVDQIFSTFLLAFGVIFILLVLQFRSIGIALISMIPNIIPLAVILGVMGAGDISLKPSTAVTFSIAFGIAVDDTIHFIVRFLSEFGRDRDYKAAVQRTLAGTGHAIITTTVILVSGFMVPLIFSEILSNRYFSMLSNVCIIAALYGDLIILPILLMRLKPRIPENAIHVDASTAMLP